MPMKLINLLSPMHICQKTFTCFCFVVKKIKIYFYFLFRVGSPPTAPHYPHYTPISNYTIMLLKLFGSVPTLTQQFMLEPLYRLPKFAAKMSPVIFFLLSFLFTKSLVLEAEPVTTNSRITVMGVVYCDICYNNTFSRHSYFISGAEVKIDCKFKAMSPKTAEEIFFSVNRTTNKFGVYKLEMQSVDGIECAEESAVVSFCQASLMRSSSRRCNVPGYKITSNEMAIKSKQGNLCFYSLSALNYRPTKRNVALCGK